MKTTKAIVLTLVMLMATLMPLGYAATNTCLNGYQYCNRQCIPASGTLCSTKSYSLPKPLSVISKPQIEPKAVFGPGTTKKLVTKLNCEHIAMEFRDSPYCLAYYYKACKTSNLGDYVLAFAGCMSAEMMHGFGIGLEARNSVYSSIGR